MRRWVLAPVALTLAVLGLATGHPAVAASARFDGYTPRFNLGQAADGAVCEARRAFDGPVADKGGRAWTVTCRGWSNTLGTLYLFSGAGRDRQDAAWRADLASRTNCAPGPRTSGAGYAARAACTTRAAGLKYLAIRAPGRFGVVAAEGRAPIADVFERAIRYLAGQVPEPPVVDKAATAVSLVSAAPVSELGAADVVKPATVEARLTAAYDRGQSWRFDEAELAFGDLARSGVADASPTARAEALYNQGLNASNNWRFDKAAIFFEQGDALSEGADPGVRGLGLNFRAADARNQRDYEGAVALADKAIATRAAAPPFGGRREADGGVTIPETSAADATAVITRADRERIRDVQALQIKATALEALGRLDEARVALLAARQRLDRKLPITGTPIKPVFLGQAAPWLNARVWADLLRLDRGTPRQAETEAYFRAAVTYFGERHPGSLPLAAFFLEQATAEAALGASDSKAEAQADADFQSAFAIFIDQRGSLADSADLARPYFDFLLRRLETKPATRDQTVGAFFNAAQALIAQSSAEAAKRQAASAQAGDGRAAALARALQDTDRLQQANQAALRRLQEQGILQGPEVRGLEAEARDLAGQNAVLQGQLLEADPHYVSALRRLVDVDTLRKALRPGEVYVKVFLLADRGYGMLISPTEAIPYRIDLTRDRAEEIVRTLRIPMDAPGRTKSGRATHGVYNVALAHDLFNTLFGPIQAQVLAARHIVFEPDATLVAAPLSALVIDDASIALVKAKAASPKALDYVGVAWLGAHSYNSIALSASAFYQARLAGSSKGVNAFYGFADPVIPADPESFSSVRPLGATTEAEEALCANYRYSLTLMHALPDTRTEVATVAEAVGGGAGGSVGRVFGADFTDIGVARQKDLETYKVVYFATHGLLDDGNPCLRTSLLTSFAGPGTGSDALLDLEKISRLRLDADVVVLSACNTGSNAHGKGAADAAPAAGGGAAPRASKLAAPKLGNGGGEALGGLVTAFVQAGARNVVVSGWEVDSATTAKLMISMFGQRHISQAGALAEAERTLMNDPRHSHPYYWAPFMVVGDGDRPMPAG